MSLNEVSIKIPGEYIPNVFGQFDAFAKKIERTLHVTLVLRDDSLKIIGAQGNIDGAKEVFEQLIALDCVWHGSCRNRKDLSCHGNGYNSF